MMQLKTTGVADWAARFLQKKQLKDRSLWTKFADVFRSQPDSEQKSWKGEFWGKMMRGAVLVYSYTQDEELYEILTVSVKDMLTAAEPDGRVSSYTREKEFCGWDLWCRKYVMLACEYYLDICRDERLKGEIISFISKCADYILEHIGEGEGKIRITESSNFWFGLNSSSVLEPIVRLYRLTKKKKYLDFAAYIIREGGAKDVNIFRLAYENQLAPYQYGVSKAYEMTSCFEGLLEYYYATGNEDCKTAVIRFADALIETELSVIGCSGVTHELFDFTRARQTVRQPDVLQETCVTVTWMKLCAKLLELTGDAKYADCMEQSFYNAYLGTFNIDHKVCDYIHKKYGEDVVETYLPVDSYSPLLSAKRGVKVGGNQLLPDGSYYGCCASIVSAGVGVFLNRMVTADERGITVNFFEEGMARLEYRGVGVEISQKTDYPVSGRITIRVKTDAPKEFDLRIRIPGWTGEKGGYTVYRKEWRDETVEADYPMPLRTRLPMAWEQAVVYTDMSAKYRGYSSGAPVTVSHNPDDDHYIALMRGPLTLAADSRSGRDAGSVFDFDPAGGRLTGEKEIVKGVGCLVKMRFTDRKGEEFDLVDYASAGRDWESEVAAWLRTE